MRLVPHTWIGLIPAVLLGIFLVSPATAQDKEGNDGIFVTVHNPITMPQIEKLKAEIEGSRNTRKNIKKVIFDFNPESKDAATEQYPPCYGLADYIRSLAANGVTPIAFVHGKTSLHSVLPVIACETLVMSSGALIGEVWSKDRPVRDEQKNYYEQLAGISRAGAVAKMIDKDVKLVQGRFRDTTIYVDIRKIEGPRKDQAYAEVFVGNKTPIPMSAGVEIYNTEQAQRFSLCQLQAETRAEVRERYQLSSESETGDRLRGKAMRPVKIVLEGPINISLREKMRRQIEVAKSRKENTFFFVLETTTIGDQGQRAALDMAEEIVKLGKDDQYPAITVAYVPGKASDLAIFMAFACQKIVMFQGPDPQAEAVLGDFDALLSGQNGRGVNSDFIRRNLEAIAEKTGRDSKVLIAGLFDKELVIVKARNNKTTERLVMSQNDLTARRKVDDGWVQEAMVKPQGTLLKLNASKAKDLKLAETVKTNNIEEVYALVGVEAKDVRSSEPSWLDDFASFLRQPHISILLVIIGISGLVLELKAPGLILPGVVAAICFVLFFWAQTQLGGQLIYLAIMLFLLGLALLGIEIFLLPGFGVAGVSGILLILAGLVLAGLDKAPESSSDWADLVGQMLRYGLTMAGAGVLAFILSRFLPHIPYANRLMLVPPEDQTDLDSASPLPGVDLATTMLGQIGTTESMLRPSGLAKIGELYVDVVTEGDFIPAGTPIQVIEVEGTRIVVKRA